MYPLIKQGKLRLATYTTYAFHMGNNRKLDDEIQTLNEKTKDCSENIPNVFEKDLFNTKIGNKFYGLKKRIVKFIFDSL
jgi:hypothetical protein